jgi:murein DD-endopeptidase MepM/ murein hydrolase activator NlpD
MQAEIERDLIEKGLMGPQVGERSDGRIRRKLTFGWPVRGNISSGFRNAAYKQYFGVPHNGVDIIVPHGTPVVAASDGIVFIARDGGATGYSYILIAHQGGYATLYGHISRFNVSNNTSVVRGSVIGWSGGTPGTYGAGPMTTGAHLHYEVIKNGVHINPQTVLP